MRKIQKTGIMTSLYSSIAVHNLKGLKSLVDDRFCVDLIIRGDLRPEIGMCWAMNRELESIKMRTMRKLRLHHNIKMSKFVKYQSLDISDLGSQII